jgi:hypothetical protein
MASARAVTIRTRKPFGPLAGTFAAAGAMTEAGSFVNSSLIMRGAGDPRVVTVHVTQRFDGAHGTFTLRADITQTATSVPGVLADEGTWALIGGTGAYERLSGSGRVTGTADGNRDVIRRTFAGRLRSG